MGNITVVWGNYGSSGPHMDPPLIWIAFSARGVTQQRKVIYQDYFVDKEYPWKLMIHDFF